MNFALSAVFPGGIWPITALLNIYLISLALFPFIGRRIESARSTISSMFRPNWSLLITLVAFLIFVQISYYFLRTQSYLRNCSKCIGETKRDYARKGPIYMSPTKARRPIGADPDGERVNATFVILARNSDIVGLKTTIPMLERRFNHRFKYPYVFLNDAPFTEAFKDEMRKLSDSAMSFGTIPPEHWSYPSWINVTKADEARADMDKRRIIYGGSLPYRHMCRFNSGFFFRHPLLQEYEYYWRVEPHVEFFCDIEYDPFVYMKKNNKKYGFVIMLHEYHETIPTLWSTTKKFIQDNKNLITENNSLALIQRDDGSYNNCHFWSNFEIGSLDFFRSEKYLRYFEYLDKTGGFFYERWGDAPVHSIAAAMFLSLKEIHYFEDIGYYHAPFYNCPSNPALQLNCNCDPSKNVNNNHECFRIFKSVARP